MDSIWMRWFQAVDIYNVSKYFCSGANLTESDLKVLNAVMAEASDKLADVGRYRQEKAGQHALLKRLTL